MTTGRRLTDQQKIDALRRALAGESYTSIAREFGVSSQNISAIIRRRTEKKPAKRLPRENRRGKLSDADKVEIVRRYQDGEGIVTIAASYDVSHQNISKLLHRRNVEMRPWGWQNKARWARFHAERCRETSD